MEKATGALTYIARIYDDSKDGEGTSERSVLAAYNHRLLRLLRARNTTQTDKADRVYFNVAECASTTVPLTRKAASGRAP